MHLFLLHNTVTPYRLPIWSVLGREHDLRVYCCERSEGYRRWGAEVEVRGFCLRVLPSFRVPGFVVNPSLVLELCKSDADAYVSTDEAPNLLSVLLVALCAKARGKPLVLWSETVGSAHAEGLHARTDLRGMLRWVYNAVTDAVRDRLYERADRVVAYSGKTRAWLEGRGVSPGRIYTGRQVMPADLLEEAAGACGPDAYEGRTVVLSLGYLQERKGNLHLLRSFLSLDRDDCALVLAGEGPAEEALRRAAAGDSRVHFPGHVDGADKARLYARADVFVLPTLHDPWGLVVNEAMYYGCPVIVTSAAGASELVREAGNGVVVEPADEAGLARALADLLDHEERRKAMGERSRSFAEAFDAERGAGVFVEVVASLEGSLES